MAEYKPIQNAAIFGHTATFLKEVRETVAIPMRDYLVEVRDTLVKEKERLQKEKRESDAKTDE